MVCVLLNKDDLPGLWLARSLKQAGVLSIQLISAEELIYAPAFSCGFRTGQAFFSVRLHNGFLFTSTAVTAVLNRISYLPQQHMQHFRNEDRSYVQAEQQATFTFLFSILPNNVFNAATGRGLSGAHRSTTDWLKLAAEAGLPVGTTIYDGQEIFTSQPTDPAAAFSVVVFGGKCYSHSSHLTPSLKRNLIALQKRSGENIIEVKLLWQNGEAYFKTATVHPTFVEIDKTFLLDLKNRL